MLAGPPRTWVLTSSPDNHMATAAHGFEVIGIKERNRARALQMEPGDPIVLYLTKVMGFAVGKWPSEHWKLAFQGQLRTVSDADAAPLMERMHAAAGVPA